MKDHEGRLQWLWTILLALAVIFAASYLGGDANAGWIYDVQGVMAPTLANPVSASFVGELEFPGELSTEGELRIGLTNEIDPETNEQIIRTAPFTMSANIGAPIGTRLFQGTWNETPFAMQWMDFQATAQNSFDASALTGGGDWDAFGIGFVDYQLGSFTAVTNRRETPQVNEPGALVLALVAGLGLIGYVRERSAGNINSA